MSDPGKEEFALFPALLVLRALRKVPGMDRLRQRARDHVRRARQPGGAWGYWFRDPPFQLPPDADDTALALWAIGDQLTSAERAKAVVQLLRHRDGTGLFLTWFDDPAGNDVDLVVNVNVLGALGPGGAADDAVRALRDRMESKHVRHGFYYPSPVALAYALAWAVDEGLETLAEPGRALFARLATVPDAVPDEELAQYLTAGLRFGRDSGPGRAQDLDRLLAMQRDDGSWPATVFALGPRPPSQPEHWYASACVHTALALEAIHARLGGNARPPER